MFWNKKEVSERELKKLVKISIVGLIRALKADIAVTEEAEEQGKIEKDHNCVHERAKYALRETIILIMGMLADDGDVFDENNEEEKAVKETLLEMYTQLKKNLAEERKEYEKNPERQKKAKEFFKRAGLE